MIDSKVQAELRARYNPDGSPLRRHQLKMLEILKYVDKVCRENNIPYWLSSGTCLGAVRHGGFIPWDDDVDIEMLGNDYDRFVKIMKLRSENKYIFQTHQVDSAFIWQYGKLRDRHSIIKEDGIVDRDYKFHGAFIDIFPMDYSPMEKINILGEYCIKICRHANKYDNSFFRKIVRNFFYGIFFKFLSPIIRYLTPESNYLHHRFGSIYHKKRNMEDIFPLKDILFEGYPLKIPYNTDNYLKNLFGEYMQLPDLKSIDGHVTEIRFLND